MWLSIQTRAIAVVAVLTAFLGLGLLGDAPVAVKIDDAVLPAILLVWTIFVIGGAGTKLSRIRFKIYRLAVSKDPSISKESIVKLYGIPKKRVERDFKLIQKYNIYPTCLPQVEEKPKEESEDAPIMDSCIESLKTLNRKFRMKICIVQSENLWKQVN